MTETDEQKALSGINVHGMNIDNTGVEVKLSGKAGETVLATMAMCFAEFLGDAPNFVTTEIIPSIHSKHPHMVVTVQRKNGKTPAETIGELQEENDKLEKRALFAEQNWEAYKTLWEAQGWQPIETAPKDGAPVLLYADHKIYLAEYEEGYWVTGRIADQAYHGYSKHNLCLFPDPTHWMSLPAPPTN